MPVAKTYMTSKATTGTAVVSDIIQSEAGAIARFTTTLFHPRGGGQREDKGYLTFSKSFIISDGAGEAYFNDVEYQRIPVLDVRHAEGGEIDHLIGTDAGPGVGVTVLMVVDAQARLENSRHHSAGHLLADLVVGLRPDLKPRQGHHWPGEARLEFDGAVDDIAGFSQELDRQLTLAVAADLPVVVEGGQNGQRSVQIGAGLIVGCGGTHIASTGELAGLCVRRVQSKKGVVRVGYDLA